MHVGVSLHSDMLKRLKVPSSRAKSAERACTIAWMSYALTNTRKESRYAVYSASLYYRGETGNERAY